MPRVDESLARAAFENSKQTGSDWRRAACPYCENSGHRDRKLSFGIAPSGFYSCFRCGIKGFLHGDEFDSFGYDLFAETKPKSTNSIEPPDGYEPLWIKDSWEAECFKAARQYLAQRGLDRTMIRQTGIGAVLGGKYQGRVIVPIVEHDKWIGWVGRSWVKKAELPYIYPSGEWRATTLYNRLALEVETDEPVMVVEGVFDAIYVGLDCGVAVLGKPSDWQLQALAQAKRPVAFVFDGDAWNLGWSCGQLLRFRGVTAGSVRLPPGADPDEVPQDWLREEVKRCVRE